MDAPAVASRLGTLAHPVRVRAVGVLVQRPLTVSQVADAPKLSSNLTSKHLRELYRAGVVWRRKEGNFVRYGLRDADVPRAILLTARSLDPAVSRADGSRGST